MKGITHITVFHTKLQCCTFYYKYHNRYDNVNNTIKCDIIERVTNQNDSVYNIQYPCIRPMFPHFIYVNLCLMLTVHVLYCNRIV